MNTDYDNKLHNKPLAGQADTDNEPPVYVISAFNLGSLLRDGPLSAKMRDACVKLLDEEMLYSLENAPRKIREVMSELYPVQDFSFLVIDDDGVIHGYIIISRYPSDGMYYVADLKYEKTEYLLALWYICASKVFMKIEPDGRFMIIAVDELKPIVDELLAPVMSGIDIV
ncbi:MAG: hypothetical protein K6E91_06735 [Butyrivibrio sp.]|nr:hypothetical protein [Butyrivibrio sp.]